MESRWCWVPGPVAVRPVYAPALVAFVGGGRFVLREGPGVAWFPLAPGEVYVPHYRGSRTYVERVNVTNTVVNVTKVTNVYNVYNSNERNVTKITYVNQRVNNGVTAVSRDTFVNARPVARNIGHFDSRQVEEAPVEVRVPVQPVRASVLGAGSPARVRPPEAIVNRQVVATRRPSPPKQPFEQREGAMNVRTEQPNTQPKPLGNQGTPRPVARPQQPTNPQEPGEASRSEMPPRPEARPQRPIATPREASPVRPAPTVPHPPEPRGGPNENDNARSAQGWSHPQARPAPPVQERNPAQAREDENKFRNWQQQRQQVAPVQNNHPPQPRPSQPRQEQHPQPRPESRQQENRPN